MLFLRALGKSKNEMKQRDREEGNQKRVNVVRSKVITK